MQNEKLIKLRDIIKNKGSLAIAFSGGVDSSLIAKVAFEELGDRSTAVTIDSDTFSRRELDISKNIASEIGITHEIVKVSELDNKDFVKNPIDRCYHCKKEEMDAISKIAEKREIEHIAFGVNMSDFSEHRPGIKALNEKNFFQPLVEAEIDKSEIPGLAKILGLSNFNLPSTTCLASRIPYGNKITAKKLNQIEDAETFLYSIGFEQSRVRNYGDLARIEVNIEQLPMILENRESIISKLKDLGFLYITFDLEGYKSGSMNKVLKE